ncbi:hypothetical protein MASR1M107_26400 [Ignavibacteriales bacterium]
MANTFSTAWPGLKPLASAPFSNLLMVIHRANTTYAPSSGALVYNISTDNGMTWSRKLPPVNSQVDYGARYPTLALRIDSGAAPSTAKAFSLFGQNSVIPEIDHGAALISDVLNATSTSVVFNSMSGISSTTLCWASDINNYFFWIGMSSGSGDILLKRTTDLGTVQSFPMFNAPALGGVIIPVRGISHKGKLFFGFLARSPLGNLSQTYLPAFVTSTDNGETWSPVQWADFRQSLGLSRFDQLWDWNPTNQLLNYSADMAVSYNGKVHFALGLQDTNLTVQQGRNAIVDLCQEGTYWAGFIAADKLNDISYSMLEGPAVGQMGYGVNIATSPVMGVYAVSWVHPTGNNPADTLCDIWFSSRLDGMYFMPVMNLTNTPGKNENNHHMASMINFANGSFSFNADIIFNYPAGYEGHFPNGGVYGSMPSVIYHSRVDIPIPLSPVELLSFTASAMVDGVKLEWTTATESNNHIFIIERNNGSGFAEIGSVAGSGTTTKIQNYSYIDKAATGGASYRLKQIDFDGTASYSNTVDVNGLLPAELVLDQNFPNPFNPSTIIQFELPTSGHTSLKVYDVTGTQVTVLIDQEMSAGRHEMVFDVAGLPSGSYFCRLIQNGQSRSIKLVIMK